jgi:hypothetical protein
MESEELRRNSLGNQSRLLSIMQSAWVVVRVAMVLHPSTLPYEDQLTVFEQGGHLGNLSNPAVQKSILGALAGLIRTKSD